MSTKKIAELLDTWEGVYKKGLLTFWILLLIHRRPAYAFEMGAAIAEFSQGTVTADEKSIYRALKRFEHAGLIRSQSQASEMGPPRRYYELTPDGLALLTGFVRRNIQVFQSPPVAQAIGELLTDGQSPRKEAPA